MSETNKMKNAADVWDPRIAVPAERYLYFDAACLQSRAGFLMRVDFLPDAEKCVEDGYDPLSLEIEL